jgi:undecaprenyl-diphosphatase
MKIFFERTLGYLKLLSIELLVVMGMLLLSLAAFTFIAGEIVLEGNNFFDVKVIHAFDLITSPALTKTALIITVFGSGLFLIPAYSFIIFYFLRNKRKQYAVMIGAIALSSLLLGLLLKELFHRPRPALHYLAAAGGFSFPSGHSLGGFTFGGVMIYLVWQTGLNRYRKWIFSILLLLFACLIGLSRIYLHVHFASDVIGSLLVTLVWLSLSFMVIRRIQKDSSISG